MKAPITGFEPELSVVTPCFNEVDNLEPLVYRINKSFTAAGLDFEIVLVDDGSSDGTWEKIVELSARYEQLRGVRLIRNFGHQTAILAGLSDARGKAVVIMDADLQHPPEMAPRFVEEWRKGWLAVQGVRENSSDVSFFKKICSNSFYYVFSLLTQLDVRSGMADFRLMDKSVVEKILAFPGRPFIRGLIPWLGYSQKEIPYRAHERAHGVAKYGFRKSLRLAMNGFSISFTRHIRGLAFLTVLSFLASVASAGAFIFGRGSSDAMSAVGFGMLAFAFCLMAFGFLSMALLFSQMQYSQNAVFHRPPLIIKEKVARSQVEVRMVS